MLGIRHNIITLLYAAKGHIENHLCRAESSHFKSEEDRRVCAEQTLKRTHTLLQRTLDITRNLGLRFKKVSDKTSQAAAPSSLRSIWARTEHCFKHPIQANRISISTSIPRHFPDLLCQDTDLQEALFLLMQNAFDALHNKTSEPWLEKKIILRAEIGMHEDEPRAFITFADNGPGISQSDLTRLFQPFFSTRHNDGGNGLGLYLVRQLISKNNGKISVSSFEGCGCTFVIELPIAAQTASSLLTA